MDKEEREAWATLARAGAECARAWRVIARSGVKEWPHLSAGESSAEAWAKLAERWAADGAALSGDGEEGPLF